ncbi:ubinuclein-1 isoform X2 [Tachysurus fulvidraco]|uniref:ubinuclein-1 isoform X2 n=1 Tax=Tachysurus fulvidraco TaxID=1234273 RepID=UPI001FEFDD9B|nr:ubinuclein-1 isoform X2 [Tachysurus fulvidraco]
MATPCRVQLTTLAVYSDVNTPSESDLPQTVELVTPPAPPSLSARIELVLFEPDGTRCAEFHYPQLTEVRRSEVDGDGDGDELQDLVTKLQKKHGEAPKQRRDRVQDLMDLGDGYDDTDSFIDNSEAYDELVPSCLTTKYGGFYINIGTLQFRPASGEEKESDDFEENFKPKKRKLNEGGDVKTKKKKKRKDDVRPKGENTEHSGVSVDKKKKVNKHQQNLNDLLRKFHKEKLQELQLFNMKQMEPSPAADQDSNDKAESSADLMMILDGADDHHQAVEQDGLLTNDQIRETLSETFPTSLPDAPTLEPSLQELPQEPQNYDQLTFLIQKLEEKVFRVMPEQIDRFNHHCRAHSEARAAKLEVVKDKQAGEGSDEEEDESSGKRVFAPRKRFRWNKEIREVLCEVVRLKMSRYELDAATDQSLEDYLKSFLEASVKTLWPRGWMQSRILLIESRRVHAHITGVVARRRPPSARTTEKGRCGAGVCPGNTGRKFEEHTDVQTVPTTKVQSGAKLNSKISSTSGGLSVPPAEVKKPQNISSVHRDVYRHIYRAPFTSAVAAMEGSCGDPALPTPSLSHQMSSPPSAPGSGAFMMVPRPHAEAFNSFPHDSKPTAHMEICTTSTLTSAGTGTFSHGDIP